MSSFPLTIKSIYISWISVLFYTIYGLCETEYSESDSSDIDNETSGLLTF